MIYYVCLLFKNNSLLGIYFINAFELPLYNPVILLAIIFTALKSILYRIYPYSAPGQFNEICKNSHNNLIKIEI